MCYAPEELGTATLMMVITFIPPRTTGQSDGHWTPDACYEVQTTIKMIKYASGLSVNT